SPTSISILVNAGASAVGTSSALFLKQDTATQGNWIGHYGSSGYVVVGDTSSNPSYVTPVAARETLLVWSGSSADSRALQKASNPADRIAAAWTYPSPGGPCSDSVCNFTIDLNFTDASIHQVAVYCLDWDTNSRFETVYILDANGNLLSEQQLTTSFNAGIYLVWAVTGHVQIRVVAPNGVVSGLFFDGAQPPPLLTISKAHTGSFVQGQTSATFTINVSNGVSGAATNGPVTVTDSFPPFLAGTLSGAGWSCLTNSCSRSDSIAGGASYPPITVTATVDRNAPVVIKNQASVSTLGSSASASDAATVVSASKLTIACTHTGVFTQSQGGTYTLTIANAPASTATTGPVTVVEIVPQGLAVLSMSGLGWTCANGECTRSDSLGAGSTYPPISVVMSVVTPLYTMTNNAVNVFWGSSFESSVLDLTQINYAPALTITKTHSGNFSPGQHGTYTIMVSNLPGVGANGTATVTENPSPGLVLQSMSGPGWTCSVQTCSRADWLNGGSSYPPITVTVAVAPNATSPQVNQATVLGDGLSNRATATDSTTIIADLALGGMATQSSTLTGANAAGKAIDGNTDGNYGDGSLTHTSLNANAWWQVDLGSSAAVSSIVVWNRTDCCAYRLSDYWVFVSDTPFQPGDTPATLQNRAGTWTSHQVVQPNPSTTIVAGAQGRYVRVQLSGTDYLSLAEVQVYGTVSVQDVALNKSASQSSTLLAGTGASKAVDGNTDGIFADGSITHTNLDANAWWQVDLGASAAVSSIVVWNRTDCCAYRLSDYWVFVSDTPFQPGDTPATLQNRAGTWSSHQVVQPNPSTTIVAGAQGRYVRVQLSGTDYLSLAEVQVYGQ
ncbi:MAG TPA: discoidin domain-containing protein, partial [Bryobacteraceae bacterium]